MPDYTFQSLSDADFEDLVADLLTHEHGQHYQTFTKGRDSGIDLLHGARIAGSTIVHCKHFARSGFLKLLAEVTKEVAKLQRLKPTRYILATSVGLTPNNKEALLALLQPFCLGIDDILGRVRLLVNKDRTSLSKSVTHVSGHLLPKSPVYT